jgi:hypothetical protein
MGVMSFLYQMTRNTESLDTGGTMSHGRRAVPFTTAFTSAMGPGNKIEAGYSVVLSELHRLRSDDWEEGYKPRIK